MAAGWGARVGKVFQVSIALWLAILCLALLALHWLDYAL
jgi:hypothetical protein